MKQVILSEEEAIAVVEELHKNWITLSNQQIIFKLIERIKRELEIE